ncbi:transglutaminase domain-containing protein [Pedobacter sp. SYP-B3415]|uniref:transglutaminase domain-containing protein n=1 Tax=Pedobacter sp. SYP-B3415 TaxID=2496641 RepID=UPI00101C258B|nr:transglutaminase domain-containing protein [Pedobacter sp. SYP-B3415]
MKFKLLLLSLFCVSTLSVKSQTNPAWEAFFRNDRTAARTQFTKLLQKPATANEARAGLCMLTDMDGSPDAGFDYFSGINHQTENGQSALLALWSDAANYSGSLKTAAQLAFYEKLAASDHADGALRAMAASLLGKHYEEMRQTAAADAHFKKIGEIENWLISGEYENISTSGFDKTYDILEHPELNYVFTGKRGRTFTWRTVPYLRHDRWFDFSYYSNYENAVVFAQTFIDAPAATAAQLRLGVSGSAKVWVNDQLVITESEERNNDLDAYVAAVKLNAGTNRILVQIGESYAGRSNFMLRLTDNHGNPLSGLQGSAVPKPYQKSTGPVQPTLPAPGFAAAQSALKSQPQSYFNQLIVAKLYLHLGYVSEARELLENLTQRFPKSTYLHMMMITLFSKVGNQTGVETLKESIRMHDPGCSMALELEFNEQLQQKNFDQARAIIPKLEKIYGSTENVLLKTLTLLGQEKKQEEVIALVEKVYPEYHRTPTVVNLKYIIESQVKQNPKALEVLKKYVDENNDYNSLKYVAKLFMEKGDHETGLNLYIRELQDDPIGYSVYIDLAQVYYVMQRYADAERLYLKALEIDPNSSNIYEKLGLLYQTMKQEAKSIAAYQQSLQLHPNAYESVAALRELQKKKSVFDYFDKPDVAALIAKAPTKNEHPDEQFVVLNSEVQRVVYENGGSQERHFYTARVLTQTGLESLKEYSIGFNNDQNLYIETAEVIKANGTKVPAETDENQIVFTNLEVGDFINIRYKLNSYHVGSLSSHVWDSFYFSDGALNMNLKYSLLIHRAKPFKYAFSQEDIKPSKTEKDEFDLYVWKKSGQQALRYEDKMPPMDDVTNMLYLSTIPDWKFVADWYENIASAKAHSSYEVRKVIRELFAGKTNLNPETKIRMIYDYITSNITYSSVSFRQSGIVPQNPSAVLNTRIGDCKDVSTLFVTLCKEAGIEASLALANTRDRGQKTLLLPSIEFNHCIAKATVNGKEYWVELTSGSLPFNTFSNTFLGSNVLEINGGSKGLISFNPSLRGRNVMWHKSAVKLENNDMIISEKNWNTGSISSYLKSVYGDLSPADQVKKMKEELSTSYPENDVMSLKFVNLKTRGVNADTVGTETSYKLINVSKPVAGMSIFSIPWSNKIKAQNLQIVAPRKFGVDLTQLFAVDAFEEELVLELPAGKAIVEVPKTLRLDSDFANFSLESSLQGNKLVLKRKFELKKDVVPADRIEDFQAFYKQVAASDEQQLAMK